MTNSERASTNIEFIQKSNYAYSIQLNRWLLMPIGVWPQDSTSTISKKVSTQIRILVCFFLIEFIVVPCTLYLFLEEKDIQLKLDTLGPLSHWITGTINYGLLLTHIDDIRECVQHMETDWKLVQRIDHQEMMLRYAKIGRFIAAFCAVVMQAGTGLFIVAKAVTSVDVVIDNTTVSIHPLTCPIYSKFIDARFSPANEIMVFIEILSDFIVTSVTVSACGLAAVFAMHAYGQLSMLFSWFNELVIGDDDKGNELAGQKIALIVKHHLRVLSFISRMEDIMQYICLVELVTCTLNMCLLVYYTITNLSDFDAPKIISHIMIYISMAFNIFIFCYIGDVLIEQCKNVGERAYMTKWYKLPHKIALDLVLIIARSNNVVKITAGKFFQLSIPTFSDVIRTSVVYLNMLRTMTTSE